MKKHTQQMLFILMVLAFAGVASAQQSFLTHCIVYETTNNGVEVFGKGVSLGFLGFVESEKELAIYENPTLKSKPDLFLESLRKDKIQILEINGCGYKSQQIFPFVTKEGVMDTESVWIGTSLNSSVTTTDELYFIKYAYSYRYPEREIKKDVDFFEQEIAIMTRSFAGSVALHPNAVQILNRFDVGNSKTRYLAAWVSRQ